MKSLCLYFLSFVFLGPALFEDNALADSASTHKIDTELGGIDSEYTGKLIQLLRNWPPKGLDLSAAKEVPVKIRCLATEGNKNYIGLEQIMKVHAPLATLEQALDDFEHYVELFPDFKDIHVVNRDLNRTDLYWEQKIPVFFIPNVKFQMIYLKEKPTPQRRIYRYQLKQSKTLTASDGIIVIEATGPSETSYVAYDFVDAKWGPVETFAPKRIWGDSVEGIYRSDLAMKLKAERPHESNEKIRNEAEAIAKEHGPEMEDCIKSKSKLNVPAHETAS